jgi:hypothetical protein
MIFQVQPQAVAKGLIAESVVQLLKYGWRLAVDDGAVCGFGILQVGNVLENWRGALGLIDAVCLRLDVLIEAFELSR